MTAEKTFQVNQPVLPIWCEASSEHQERELLFGECFRVQQKIGDLGFGEAVKDGYAGYVDLAALKTPTAATHVVSGFATHLYPKVDIKSPPIMGLSFGSQLTIDGSEGIFLNTADGQYVPANQTRPINADMDDPTLVAELFLGTPYLWGGNSCWGIDCSGLVQAALLACGVECPADSGQQRDTVGRLLGDNEPVESADLLFWKGHVAMALDRDRLIHATAYHMAVVVEGINEVTGRIAGQGFGSVLARRRP